MLRRRVLALNLSYLQFFEVAHQAIFGRVGSLNDDYAQFLQHAVVPKYVEAYLDRLAMEEHKDSYLQPDGQVRPLGENHVSS